nr:alanine racemase [Altericroceibacterium endophyticum]
MRLALDQSALAENWRYLNRMSGSAQAGAAVKADGYGLGADRVVPVLRDAGVQDFFVAHWSEAHSVARHIPAHRISVLHGAVNREEAEYGIRHGIRPVINSLHQARVWQESGGGLCHVMVDSGMSRLGLSLEDVSDPVIAALDIDLAMSHLASADEDVAQNALQLERSRAAFAQLPARRFSLANSAGIMLGRDYHFDLTRPGLSLYGGIARPEMAGNIRQVAIPQAAVIQKRRLQAGDSVGYNARFVAPGPMNVAVISLGYADGLLRLQQTPYLEFDRKKLPVLGNISMDMTIVDIGQAPDLREGDWVNLPYDLRMVSDRSQLSQYELLTILGLRLR